MRVKTNGCTYENPLNGKRVPLLCYGCDASIRFVILCPRNADNCRMHSRAFSFFSLLAMGCLVVSGDVIVLDSKNHTIDIFPDLPASFGAVLPEEGLRGFVVGSNPPNACEPIIPPPVGPNVTGPFFALIRRYGCTFTEKVKAAQAAGYHAAIIYNVGSNIIGNLIIMRMFEALSS